MGQPIRLSQSLVIFRSATRGRLEVQIKRMNPRAWSLLTHKNLDAWTLGPLKIKKFWTHGRLVPYNS